MFTIVITEKGGKTKRIDFDEDTITIGRIQGNHVTLPRGNVSKHHARLEYEDGEFKLSDLSSTNGTYINGRKVIGATIVRPQDKVYVGEFILRFEPKSPDQKADKDAEKGTPVAPLPMLKPRGAAIESKLPLPKLKMKVQDSTIQQHSTVSNESNLLSSSNTENDLLREPITTPAPSPPSEMFESFASFKQPESNNCDNQELLQQMIFHATAQVEHLDVDMLPSHVKEDTAAEIRLVLRNYLSEQKKLGALPEGINKGALLSRAFRALVNLGPLSKWLDDPQICYISIINPETIDLRIGEKSIAATDHFGSNEDLTDALSCLSAGLNVFEDAGATGLVRYRLEDGAMVFASAKETGQSTPSAIIYKNISPSLIEHTNVESTIAIPAKRVIAKALTAGERLAIVGAIAPYRMSVLTEIVGMISPEELVVGVEKFPMIGFGGGRRISLSSALSKKTLTTIKNIAPMLDCAANFNPHWITVVGVAWSDVPALLPFAIGREGIIAELPLGPRGNYGQEFAAGLASTGRSVTINESENLLNNSFDLIIVVSEGLLGHPKISRIIRTRMIDNKWSPELAFETDDDS